MEHVIRQCLIALRMAERLGFEESERAVVYYSGLLAWVGCHTDAYEQAKWLGDDIQIKHDAFHHDMARVGPAASYMLNNIGGADRPLMERARVVLGFFGDGRRAMAEMLENHYLATDELAQRLGLGDDVRASLKQSFETWNGRGPFKLKGDEILLTSRVINLADVVEVFHRSGRLDDAIAVARERSGTQFDPELVELFCDDAEMLMSGLDAATGWDAVIAAEPSLEVTVSEEEFDDVLLAIGDFTELKSPWTMGHARGVAELATEAARQYGMPEGDVVTLRRAAFIHDIGRLGVSNLIWDKR